MHLKQLKIAGFKSFVDPTVVDFPNQLTGIVGPNGCGKSNLIDAFRWVLGESSAKNLRGESMADVIFNGSSNRKPLGQASVELVFDNSLGRMTGAFASYGEVAVKRLVTRDGESSYFLNGGRCRRRDITDIFLGTGAGARGYSIIGQGTISKLIEAKPEELRAFLEEAAGVSKYKERRRETLLRIEHTRDNLTRVADIRDELDKQLQRLERQAKAAERYTALKVEEHQCRAEILAIKWQDLVAAQTISQRQLQTLAVDYEHKQSLLTGATKDRTILNEQFHEANDQTQQIQTVLYQLGTDIARLEETIQQQERDKRRLENDRQQMQADLQILVDQLKQDQENLVACQQNVALFNQRLDLLNADLKTKENQWQETHLKEKLWAGRWQEVQEQINRVQSELQLAQLNKQHIEQKRQETLLRLEKIAAEQSQVSIEELQQIQLALEAQQSKLQSIQTHDDEQLKQENELTQQLRTHSQEIEQQLHQFQDEYHRHNSEHAALTAIQKSAKQISKKQDGVRPLAEKSRLMDVLQIEPKWQLACDRVFNDTLHALVLDSLEELWPQWDACKTLGESVVTLRKSSAQKSKYPTLASKMNGKIPAIVHDLTLIYTAEDLDQALSWLPDLLDHESVVTANGLWLGRGWVQLVSSEEEDELGILARQQKISDLAIVLQDMQQKINACKSNRAECLQRLQDNLRHLEAFELNLKASNDNLRDNWESLKTNEQAILHAEKMRSSMAEESQDLQCQLEEAVMKKLEFDEKCNLLENQNQILQQQQTQMSDEKQVWIDRLANQRGDVEACRFDLHQLEKDSERERFKATQLQERIAKDSERQAVLQERLEQLTLLSLQSTDPGLDLTKQLAEAVAKHQQTEANLAASREQFAQIRMSLDALEKSVLTYDNDVKKTQELISQTRMEEQALAVRADSVLEALNEFELKVQDLISGFKQDITQSQKEEELLQINEKIKRLGAINLAAIEEFTTEQQRKNYLDEQYNDLSQALGTLEAAIEKMDKETRQRLETTFDEVNTAFKSLFPRLFGGGRAQLELTCDNLLEAGIVVMAQPPGKRNSTIHLLSGGEKAMTAVALVFAIFQLNPSPFCMLDEVDAPLDDVNVGRFCDLVKEMSQFVQFLFITHNKVTMELADHLIGVTMREPGVSRLVTVDVKHALTME